MENLSICKLFPFYPNSEHFGNSLLDMLYFRIILFNLCYVIVLLTCFYPASAETSSSQSPNEKVLVQVGPEKVTEADYQSYLQYRQLELQKSSYPLSPQFLEGFQKRVLNEIVEQTLVFLLATRENISYSDEEFKKSYDDGINLLGGDKEYQRWLKSFNLTDDYMKEQIKKKIIVEKYMKKIEETVSVSDKEVEEAYQKLARSGAAKRTTDTYDFANILLLDFVGSPETEKKAYKIYQSIQEGEDFFLLAKQYSQDPFSSKQNYTYYEMPLKQVSPEIKHCLVMLPVGSVSQPFRTRNGWNIIKILAKNTVGGTISFNKMEKGLKQRLVSDRVRDILQQELEKLQKEITVTYYYKN